MHNNKRKASKKERTIPLKKRENQLFNEPSFDRALEKKMYRPNYTFRVNYVQGPSCAVCSSKSTNLTIAHVQTCLRTHYAMRNCCGDHLNKLAAIMWNSQVSIPEHIPK